MKPRSHYSFLKVILSGCFVCGLVLRSNPGMAQLVPDNSLGNENSEVNSIDPTTQQIDGGAIRGENLFHSFTDFNVGEGQTVNFNNPNNINYIFTRVTGNNLSEIMGELGIINGNADLFLLNPNGIIFGENSSLNLSGSFISTTATTVNFADGSQFKTTDVNSEPLLTISRPLGLVFEREPGTITNNSFTFNNHEEIDFSNPEDFNKASFGLEIQPQKTLALVGGDIVFEGGTITTFGANTELGSVDINSEINLSQDGEQWQLNYNNVDNFRNIEFVQGFIDAKSTENNSSNVTVVGKDITLNDNSQIFLTSLGDTNSGELIIQASGKLELFQDIEGRTVLGSLTSTNGNSGNIRIDANQLVVGNNSRITTDSTIAQNTFTGEILGEIATGNGGNLTINVSESVEIKGDGTISAATSTIGNGGVINITTQKLNINDEGLISTSSVVDLSLLTGEPINIGEGDAGTINIEADSLEINNNGSINSETIAKGEAGSIDFTVKDLTINGGNITVSSEENSIADAGDINIEADNIFLQNNGSISAETIQTNGGNINLTIAEQLQLRTASNISTNVGGNGDGGNINIDSQFIIAIPEENSDISTNAVSGNAGRIDIQALDLIGIQFQETPTNLSGITAFSDFGLDGTVETGIPDTTIDTSIINISSDTLDISDELKNSYCRVSRFSSYVVTGRGGLPLTSSTTKTGETTWEDWRIISSNSQTQESSVSSVTLPETEKPSENNLTPIRGWKVNEKGQIILTAEPIMVTPNYRDTNKPSCN